MDSFATEERRAPSPQSVTRVIRILEVLCASAEPVSLADLSRRLGTPKSSLAALLRGLADEDFVVPAEGAWRLGPGAFGLGSALAEARRRFQSSDLIRDGMRRLAEKSGETVLLAVSDDDLEHLTYVEVIESRNSVRFAVSVGDRRPLYATAGGRALLAARTPEELHRYLDHFRPEKHTPATLTEREELADAIADIRRAGVSRTVDQAAQGVTGTAAAIREASGRVLGALVVAAPSHRMTHDEDALAGMVRDEAAAISRSLGYREPIT